VWSLEEIPRVFVVTLTLRRRPTRKRYRNLLFFGGRFFGLRGLVVSHSVGSGALFVGDGRGFAANTTTGGRSRHERTEGKGLGEGVWV
jgi:hypothetical protein